MKEDIYESWGSTGSLDQLYIEPRKLQEAGKIMGIELMDHVITGEQNYVSLKEKDCYQGKREKGKMDEAVGLKLN